jgi:hypothetical protein
VGGLFGWLVEARLDWVMDDLRDPGRADEVSRRAASDVRGLLNRPGFRRVVRLAESLRRGDGSRRPDDRQERSDPPRRRDSQTR